jgi:DNA polymerase-3 subunit epsilon
VSRLWGTPGHLRLVVLDLETCVAPDKAHRIVSIGVAVCRGGAIKERREWLVNPGCPVDPFTQSKHLVDEPRLDEVWPALLSYFTAKPAETTVLATHFTAFDIPVLRNDLARIGAGALPDMPVLDTAGTLCAIAALRTTKRSLEAVIGELGIVNAFEHNALSDATATAQAAIEMLARAEAAGHDDLGDLLSETGGERTGSMKLSAPKRPARRDSLAPVKIRLPETHVQAHANAADLTIGPLIAACAALRCGSLATTMRAARPDAARRHLFAALRASAAASDVAGAATALGALAPLLASMPQSLPAARAECPGLTRFTGTVGPRGVAVAVADWLATVTAPLSRCDEEDPCPACRDGRPCPLDVWPMALVPLAINLTPATVTAFWNPTAPGIAVSVAAKGAGRGWLAMHRNAPRLADATLRVCHEFAAKAQPAVADLVADQVWAAGCRDPYIAEARVVRIAVAGRPADLRAAIADCRTVLAVRAGNTDPAWASLAVRAAQLEGRLVVLEDPAHRRARQANAKRPPRPPRFLRSALRM